jgi:serine/threonine protein kinase
LAWFVNSVGLSQPDRLGLSAHQPIDVMGTSNEGLRLGVYQLHSLLGAAGMGEVYLAHDTRLGRDVAIKILPHAFTNDSERLARLEREARVLASLNPAQLDLFFTGTGTPAIFTVTEKSVLRVVK